MWLFGSKDYKLFDLFGASANVVVRAGALIKNLVEDYDNLDERMKQLTALEDEGDQIIEALFQKLNQSFILPFDREDAYALVQKLDSILDYIAGIVDRIVLYKATQPNQVVSNLTEVLEKAIKQQERAFKLLSELEHKRKEIMECCDQITALEKQGDTLYRQAMVDLFEGQYDAMTIIKWKEIYEHIETTLDRCEDVSILIRGICIKYS
ncbi:MAG: DUF47 domain-containing protein [Syntrophomonadaceae bacterium]|nr:DUF47 domain-containing protein [Syntrophomonadaceae bacterium]